MGRKHKLRRKHKFKLGKALNVVETVGEAAARFGGAIPLVGGAIAAAGNAMDLGAERARKVKDALTPKRRRKRRKHGKVDRHRPDGLTGNGRPEAPEAPEAPEGAEAPEADVPEYDDGGGESAGAGAGPSRVGLAVGAAVVLGGLALAMGRR